MGGTFAFDAGDEAGAMARMKALLVKRVATQPLGRPNAGSVFRNPPGDHAARLIEACGLKGFAVGGAQVSPQARQLHRERRRREARPTSRR